MQLKLALKNVTGLVLKWQITCRVSLVDKGGDHLLHYPVVEREGPVEGPIRAVAKCKQGTAAWQAFHLSHLLRSDQHPDRCSSSHLAERGIEERTGPECL